jgi:hypothetical protein
LFRCEIGHRLYGCEIGWVDMAGNAVCLLDSSQQVKSKVYSSLDAIRYPERVTPCLAFARNTKRLSQQPNRVDADPEPASKPLPHPQGPSPRATKACRSHPFRRTNPYNSCLLDRPAIEATSCTSRLISIREPSERADLAIEPPIA